MKSLRLAASVLTTLSLLSPTAARAMDCPDDLTAPYDQCQCAHGPLTLPGLSGPPEWADVDGDGFWRPEIHDPRWAGAPLFDLGYSDQLATVGAVQGRVLSHGNYLYVSLQVLTDDEGPDYQDTVYFGITQGSASQAYAMRIYVQPDGSTVTAPTDPDPSDSEPAPQDDPLPHPQELPLYVTHWISTNTGSFSDASVTDQDGKLPFVDQLAIWRPDVPVPAAGPNRRWSVTMRIDKSATGLNPSAGSIRIFLGTEIHFDGGGSPDLIPFATSNPATAGVGGTIIPLSTNDWVRYADLTTACTAGVSVSRSDIGVYAGTPGSDPTGALTRRICAADPCPASTPGGNPENVFRAIVRNVSGGVTDWDVRANFRIADWGSTVANRKYGPWTTIPATPSVNEILNGPDTNLTHDTNDHGWHWQDTSDGAAADSVVIDYKCDKGSNVYCPTLTNPANDHQCMMVELGLPAGSSREIATAAVYQNMDFYGLSTLNRPATISIQGLKDITGTAKDRDVYLYVERENMPAHQEKPLWLPAEAMQQAKQLAQNPIPIPRQYKPKPGTRAAAAVARLGRDAQLKLESQTKAQIERVSRTLHKERRIGKLKLSNTLAMSQEQVLDTVWPTLRIRPYYDTGRTRTVKGKTSKVLAPMVPFGFYLSHDGPFYGFTHSLQAADPGLVLTKLSDYWYKVNIKSEGAVHLRTVVSAEEQPPPPGTGGSGGQPVKVDCKLCKEQCSECQVKPGRCNCGLLPIPNSGLYTFGILAVLGALLAWRRRERRAS